MKKLPLLISVPHGGLTVPPEARPYNILTHNDILEDGDAGAPEIYDLEDKVEAFIRSNIGRAFVDMNRPEDDFSQDGVIKTHTCLNVPVYDPPLPRETAQAMLERYYRPYHRQLTDMAGKQVAAVDCHTMFATAPPIDNNPGQPRPLACVSDGDGTTCPPGWAEKLAYCLSRHLAGETRVNDPFKGGHITCSHAAEMPWLQLEIARTDELTNRQKHEAVLQALSEWLKMIQ